MEEKKLIQYFSDCYTADNREFIIENFFASKYENQWIQELDEELINRTYTQQYLPVTEGEAILKNLQLYERDKQAYYCTLFIIGKRKLFSNKTVRICAPIFYYPVDVVLQNENYFTKLTISDRQVNYGFLKSLSFKTSFDLFFDDFSQLIEQAVIDYPFIAKLKRIFEKHCEEVSFDTAVSLYPKLAEVKKLKREINKRDKEFNQYKVFTASGIMVSSKANNIQNVVNELETLKNLTSYSTALQSYVGKIQEVTTKTYKLQLKPFILNNAQERIVKAANEYTKSIVIGPPGTGKTYTVGAIAIDYLSQGKSVLIATKTDEALQVISEKLNDFSVGKYRIKIGGSRYKISLLATLRRYMRQDIQSKFNALRPYVDSDKLNDLDKKLKKLEKEFNTISEKSNTLTENVLLENGFVAKLKKKWIKLFKAWSLKEWQLLDEYFDTLNQYIGTSNKHLEAVVLNNIINAVDNSWKEWSRLIEILNSSDEGMKIVDLERINFDIILKALPIWLTKIDEVGAALPMQKELFDVLIVDEATQCDMASVLPLMQRAKKVVITGDPKQLRHISFLSQKQMQGFVSKHKLEWKESYNYRTKSLLDFTLEHTTSRNQINTLNEHYRSLPDIIKYSNTKFYENDLMIMNDLPKHKEDTAVNIYEVNGKREEGVNEQEVNTIIKYIKTLIREEIEVKAKSSTTIGVISPFKDQVKRIGKRLKTEFEIKELRKHQIRIGTPYAFQGDERDVMLLSMAVDETSHASALNYINKEDVFNVMVTRARNKQEIFTSIKPNQLKFDSLLREYLEGIKSKNEEAFDNEAYLDQFTEEVLQYLQEELKMECHLGYQLSGLIIDIMVAYDGRYYGVDLIGYPGEYQEAFSMERYKVLHRVGIQVIPLSYVTWYFDTNVKMQLKNLLIP